MLLTFDPMYWLMLAPALLLGLWAQARVRSTFARAEQEPAPMSGAAAARYVLDSAGLQNVAVEPVDGFLSDHYDPRAKVLRLSPQVYQNRSMAAVGSLRTKRVMRSRMRRATPRLPCATPSYLWPVLEVALA